jgi:hypothetical protein
MRLPDLSAGLGLSEASQRYRRYGMPSPPQLAVGMAAHLPIDPCRRCNAMTGCAKARCECICNDGVPIPSHISKCGFLCT